MSDIIFTRYLYCLDEVIYSLFWGLIEKKNFTNIIFWTNELYYSKFYDELWNFIFKFYYDFCAVTNLKMFKLLKKKYDNWQINKSIVTILEAMGLLYYSSNLDFNVFVLRNSVVDNPIKIYRGREPKWLRMFADLSIHYERKEKAFLRSLKDKDLQNINFYLSQFKTDAELNKVCEIISNYFNIVENTSIECFDLINDSIYKNKKHMVMAVICHMFMKKNKKRIIKKKINEEQLDFWNNLNSKTTPTYKTLREKRHFSLHENVSYLNLKRPDRETLNNIFWYQWEYYCRDCPLWQERFKQYSVTFDEEKKEPIFPNDDLLEEFYENYGLEPDEQPSDVQQKSLELQEKKSTLEAIMHGHYETSIHEIVNISNIKFKNDFDYI